MPVRSKKNNVKVEPRYQLLLKPKSPIEGMQAQYEINRFPATIGRHPTNDVELPFEPVSRYHARVEIRDAKPTLIDLHSSNGTYVNNRRIQVAAVRNQDTLAFGSLEFLLELAELESPEVAPRAETDGDSESTSVHFVQHEEDGQTVYHTEIPEDTSQITALEESITNEQQLRKAKQQLISLYRLQDVLRSTTDEVKLLQGVLDLLFEVLPVDRGVMLTRNEQDPSLFKPVAIKTRRPAAREQIGISKTILQRCLREKVAILTRDAVLDERFEQAESIISNRMRSVICVPLISVRRVFGFCHLDTTDAVRAFNQSDLTFLANVGFEVATHLHNLRMLSDRIRAERMAAIGQTITGMAHNIKNILVLSQGGIDMMEKRLARKDYEAMEETWAVVRRGLGRINKLVQDMLDYSRSRHIEKKQIDVNVFIRELCQGFMDEFTRRGITCNLDLDDTIPELMLDADGLEKALVNLIVNAAEACTEDIGRIEIATRLTDEENLRITVTDNAGGIPADVLPRIFAPFFTTKGSKGSGLGLAMTKKFIEDMGGLIEASSVEGEGTTFEITIFTQPGAPRLDKEATTGSRG